MPQPTTPVSVPRRLRAAALGVQGGASSLIRLSRGAPAQLPSGAALSQWAARATVMLHHVR